MLTNHFQLLAKYNTLANRKLYEACAQLSDDERKQTRPAFFKSIHGTLNHIMVGDRIWLGRFEGKAMPSTNLDAILYKDFDELRQVRQTEDERIKNFAAGLTEDFLSSTIQYKNNSGRVCNDPTNLLVAHFFNHQTHHRGQIHDMISQTKIAPPSLDMHRIIQP
ncbi:DinB family protein [Gloeocapsopsis dulcis]|uniref:Damage-inducible protein DinB n=1 Tax=Gloeocapsopsis dulcis AAB1 = 1H9 TaxID=1433147 RepID=A0A6N8FVY3_9CHRO|nr:DinB family protein [Gloeocapsopsis dulcis]MUL36106.1 damage-inducible protein DinB [Gloeocapsopsis dulcis AAB1 = 1H9]WNN91422.1 DinB family protein [Gloeocapsopsis dulcis]